MTLNDLVLRDMFLTVRAHNVRTGGAETAPDGGPAALRINVPVNLRGPADLPAALAPRLERSGRGSFDRNDARRRAVGGQ